MVCTPFSTPYLRTRESNVPAKPSNISRSSVSRPSRQIEVQKGDLQVCGIFGESDIWLCANPASSNLMSHEMTIPRALRWNVIEREPSQNRFARWRGRVLWPSFSFPLRETREMAEDIDSGNRCVRSRASREKIKLRWEDSLA